MLEKLNEKVLDELYKLQLKRQNQIEENGAAVSLASAQSAYSTLIPSKSLKEGSTFYFAETSPVEPGDLLRPIDSIPAFLVTSTETQAGRIKCETLELPTTFSLLQKFSKGLNVFQQPVYGIRSTRWNNIPCTSIIGNTVKIPKLYTPEIGELLLVNGQTYEVLSTSIIGSVAVVTVREW